MAPYRAIFVCTDDRTIQKWLINKQVPHREDVMLPFSKVGPEGVMLNSGNPVAPRTPLHDALAALTEDSKHRACHHEGLTHGHHRLTPPIVLAK